MEAESEIQYIQTCLEYAPTQPGRLAPELVGWASANGLFVCAKCAGRIMARGCRLLSNSEPVWNPDPRFCVGCQLEKYRKESDDAKTQDS